MLRFLSTLSLRRATGLPSATLSNGKISIHALLAESDPTSVRNNQNNQISIHALLAESDLAIHTKSREYAKFLSTLSLRRATLSTQKNQDGKKKISIHALLAESDARKNSKCRCLLISIHALLAESDWALMGGLSCNVYFYPRSPCGERRQVEQTCRDKTSISIHALLAESDIISIVLLLPQIRFLSTLSLRRATAKSTPEEAKRRFLSTLSLRRATFRQF